ncbi:MAG: enoyl-CoA hydratase [Chromatiales bacterium]|jgi:enoyl-CoA hydratase|nr:enoyl-CoA hydratase [Chromatiales bacterium]
MVITASVDVNVQGSVAHVTLNQPSKRNAMRLSMWEGLRDGMTSLAANDDVRIVVVSGAGDRAFCAGADISEFDDWRGDPEKAAHYDAITRDACNALEHFPKPTIGRIMGSCIGGGFELALLCDIRISARSARFAVTPAKLGLGYNMHDTQLLVDRIGAPATREILFTGRMFTADDALRLGIVNRVVDEAELDSVIEGYVNEIATNAPITVQASKAIIAEAVKTPADQNAALCQSWVDRCYASADFIEGRRAFGEKRKPQFTGQ